MCLQETKAQEHQLTDAVFRPAGYKAWFKDASTKKGYSGVAIYTRSKPQRVIQGMNDDEFDREGRYLEVDLGKLTVVSLYLPSGSSSPERQAAKFRFLERFLPHLRALAASGRGIVLCGDWNIAHQAIDLKNWRSNQKNSGFLPEERAWLTQVFDEVGWVDVFRRLNKLPDQYTLSLIHISEPTRPY